MSSLHHEQAKKKATERKSGTLKPRRLLATVVLTMLAAVVIAIPATAAKQPPTAAKQPLATLNAKLTTEMPGPGDPNGHGTAMFQVYKTKLCYKLSVMGIKPATEAHIHQGAKGQTGPIVVPTDQTSFNLPRPTSTGCEPIPSSLSTAIRQNPSNYYVNVHNKPYPEGAIRGQLRMMKGM
jgi:Fe2+ transport system protein FeoA